MKRVIVTAASKWQKTGDSYFNPEFPQIEIVYDDRDSRYYIYENGTDIGRRYYSLDQAADYVWYNYPDDHVGNETYQQLKEFRGIKGGMTDAEVEDAILNNKPFDFDSFKKYRYGDMGHKFRQNAVTPSEIKIGKTYINTEDASEFDLGTKFTVLDILDPKSFEDKDERTGRWESRFDYVFKVKDENGNVFNIHYDEDEYVGVEV